jgi:hypothetical protein
MSTPYYVDSVVPGFADDSVALGCCHPPCSLHVPVSQLFEQQSELFLQAFAFCVQWIHPLRHFIPTLPDALQQSSTLLYWHLALGFMTDKAFLGSTLRRLGLTTFLCLASLNISLDASPCRRRDRSWNHSWQPLVALKRPFFDEYKRVATGVSHIDNVYFLGIYSLCNQGRGVFR